MLLYLGPVYLKDILSDKLYNHFMLLFCAITILISESLNSQFNDHADTLLRLFVTEAATLYGKEFIAYNVHNRIHLSAHAKQFGSLDNFSAFPFENFLYGLKRMLRKTTDPLQQMCRRLKELELSKIVDEQCVSTVTFSVVPSSTVGHTNRPSDGISGTHYKIVGRDSCVYLDSGTIIKIANFIQDEFNG